MSKIENLVVMITGASSGIGEATARALAARGAKLVLGARRTDRLAKLAAELGPDVIYRATDVAVHDDLKALAGLGIEQFGRIDVLVNNAGTMPLGPLALGNAEDWSRMIDVNVKGVLYGIDSVLGHMLARGSGNVINIASVAAHVVGAGGAVYCATKYAVWAISEGLRKECAGKIRVTTICPGAIVTELADSITVPGIRDAVRAMSDAGAPPSTIANAVIYALEQPDDFAINEIILRPLAQEN